MNDLIVGALLLLALGLALEAAYLLGVAVGITREIDSTKEER